MRCGLSTRPSCSGVTINTCFKALNLRMSLQLFYFKRLMFACLEQLNNPIGMEFAFLGKVAGRQEIWKRSFHIMRES